MPKAKKVRHESQGSRKRDEVSYDIPDDFGEPPYGMRECIQFIPASSKPVAL